MCVPTPSVPVVRIHARFLCWLQGTLTRTGLGQKFPGAVVADRTVANGGIGAGIRLDTVKSAYQPPEAQSPLIMRLIFWVQNPWLKFCFFVSVMGIPTLKQFVLATVVHWLMIGTCMTLGYHRYGSHHAFSIGRVGQFLLVAFTQLGWQGGVLWWAAKHRRHHKHCDTPLDPHSWAQTSYLYALLGWTICETETEREYVPKHLIDFPELWFLNTFHCLPGLCMMGALFYSLGWDAMIWGYAVPSTSSALQTFHFNLEFHPPGEAGNCFARNECGDKIMSWIPSTLVGEARHEDHHAHPQRALRPGGDPPYWLFLAPLKALGVITNVHDGRGGGIKSA
jgi:fatty-acid desaturase